MTRPMIDAHVHLLGPKERIFQACAALGIREVVNITYGHEYSATALGIREGLLQQDMRNSTVRCHHVTTFSLQHVSIPGLWQTTVDNLAIRLTHPGTIGVKIWKDLGMRIRDTTGAYLMPDDGRLAPILQMCALKNRIIYLHCGDPIYAWSPLQGNQMREYYRANRRYHMWGKSAPSHGAVLQARDRMIERWPQCRFIACHLASMCHDLEGLREFLETHTNVWLDTAGRLDALQRAPRAMVRALFADFSSRVLFGTDWTPPQNAADVTARAERRYLGWLAFLKGELGLESQILDRVLHDNAAALISDSHAS